MTDVLIVEDDLSIADLLQVHLEAAGYSVCGIARTFKEARDSAEQHEPDSQSLTFASLTATSAQMLLLNCVELRKPGSFSPRATVIICLKRPRSVMR
jgi:DNA-binding response OmpR family regulator